MNVNNLKQVGRSLYLLGKHKTALDVFEEAEQLNSEDREIWHNKGMCYLYLKQYDKSLECFELANSIQRNEITYTQMGRVHRLTGTTRKLLNTGVILVAKADAVMLMLSFSGLMIVEFER